MGFFCYRWGLVKTLLFKSFSFWRFFLNYCQLLRVVPSKRSTVSEGRNKNTAHTTNKKHVMFSCFTVSKRIFNLKTPDDIQNVDAILFFRRHKNLNFFQNSFRILFSLLSLACPIVRSARSQEIFNWFGTRHPQVSKCPPVLSARNEWYSLIVCLIVRMITKFHLSEYILPSIVCPNRLPRIHGFILFLGDESGCQSSGRPTRHRSFFELACPISHLSKGAPKQSFLVIRFFHRFPRLAFSPNRSESPPLPTG